MNTRTSLICLLAFCLFTLTAFAPTNNDELLGLWKYKVADVPQEYETGVLRFEQRDNKTVGFVDLTKSSQMPMRDLVVKEGKVSFKLTVESSDVDVTLVKKGGQLSGKVVSSDGEFSLVAEKVLKK